MLAMQLNTDTEKKSFREKIRICLELPRKHFYAQVSPGQFRIGAIGGHLFTIRADMEPT